MTEAPGILFLGDNDQFEELKVPYSQGKLIIGKAREDKGIIRSCMRVTENNVTKLFGQVFANPENFRKTYMFLAMDENKTLEKLVIENSTVHMAEKFIDHKKSSLDIFSDFIDSISLLEVYLRDLVGAKEEHHEVIPEEFHILLEFDFFRQIIPSSKSFSFSYGFIKSFDNKNRLSVAIEVNPIDEKEEGLVFIGIVEY